MRVWSDWGFTSDWWRGLRGEYWVIAQGILLLGFIILPTDTPSFIDLEISAWQYIRWILTAIFGIGAVIILGQALIDLGRNLTPLPHPKDDGEFVQTGIYSVVRHPIYAGVIGLAFAYGFWLMSWVHGLGAIALFMFFDCTLTWMNESFTRLSRLKAFPGEGWIKSVEVTKGRKGDAHPHFHVLMAVKSSYFGRDYLSQKKWCELWQKSLRVDYQPVLDIQAVKAQDSLVALIAEIVKYQTKASNLIGHGTEEDRQWFLEYTRQIMNTKAISIGGIFKDYFRELEQEPEDLIGEDEDETGVDEGHLYFGWKRQERKYKLI